MNYNTNINLSTTKSIPPGYRSLGIVKGIQVKSMNIFRDAMTGFASLFGTGKKDWTGVKNLFDETRDEAIYEMINRATNLGATDIVGIRIQISELSRGSEGMGMLVVSCYGTALTKDAGAIGGKIYKKGKSKKGKYKKGKSKKGKSKKGKSKK